jgi:hypothetical protein
MKVWIFVIVLESSQEYVKAFYNWNRQFDMNTLESTHKYIQKKIISAGMNSRICIFLIR